MFGSPSWLLHRIVEQSGSSSQCATEDFRPLDGQAHQALDLRVGADVGQFKRPGFVRRARAAHPVV